MYLLLSVAGHLTIFQTRTRGPCWSIRPARILLIAVFGTQTVATLIAVFGLFMTPLGWGWALFVWGYALSWFFVTDGVKLVAYRFLDPAKAEAKPEGKTPEAKAEAKPAAKVGPKPDPKAEDKPYAKVELQPDATAAHEPEAKGEPNTDPKADTSADAKPGPEPESTTRSDLAPQLVKRVHELYEQLGREDVQAVQDWEKAQREIKHESPEPGSHK
jgi:H+-transporting ATPase